MSSETGGVALVQLRSVSQRFGHRLALDRFSLAVAPGIVVGLLGPNGAGKTSVVNLLAGLARPTGGDVAWEGRPLPYPFPVEVRRRLGLVPQDTALYQDLSVTQNLRFAADLYGVAERAAAIAGALRLAGLEERAADRVSALSGGMRRRLALARATLHRPRLLLLDEPTLGVDLENRHAIWGHVRQLRGEGVTVVLSTNYLDEAEALCDRVVALREGRQVAEGVPPELASAAGRCVEIACPPEAVEAVRRRLGTLTGIEHIEVEPIGLAATLRAGTDPEPVAEMALRSGGVTAVRIRAPDLAEVFRALAAGHPAIPGNPGVPGSTAIPGSTATAGSTGGPGDPVTTGTAGNEPTSGNEPPAGSTGSTSTPGDPVTTGNDSTPGNPGAPTNSPPHA